LRLYLNAWAYVEVLVVGSEEADGSGWVDVEESRTAGWMMSDALLFTGNRIFYYLLFTGFYYLPEIGLIETDFLAGTFASSEDSRLPFDFLFFGLTAMNCDVEGSDKEVGRVEGMAVGAGGTPATVSASIMSTSVKSGYDLSGDKGGDNKGIVLRKSVVQFQGE